jgi:molybdopterin converting factor subunit 1
VMVRVLLFARLRELVGSEALELELKEGATLGELWSGLQNRFPPLAGFARPPLMAVNQVYASPDRTLTAEDEIAFFPPVSGG